MKINIVFLLVSNCAVAIFLAHAGAKQSSGEQGLGIGAVGFLKGKGYLATKVRFFLLTNVKKNNRLLMGYSFFCVASLFFQGHLQNKIG